MNGSFARRLGLAQALVLLTMGAITMVTAWAVGPAVFDEHMRQAGHANQPAVLLHAREAFRTAGLASLGVGLGFALLVAAAASVLVNRTLARALQALIDGAARVSHGDYDHPVAMPPSGPELAQVADEFNHMAAQVADTEATRRRMLTDLAHEMRTPLASTRVTLEALQDGVLAFSPEALDVLVQQNQRLARLSADISEVSAAEEGRITLERRRVVASQLVAAAVAANSAAYEAAGVQLLDLAEHDVAVLADPARIGQVLDNLLRNALQHTRRGDTVTVRTTVAQDQAVVSVDDTGAGIGAEHLPHLFERFYRADRSRTRDGDAGTGVGLAIARAIARSHGGDLTAASDGPGAGATFSLRLPATA